MAGELAIIEQVIAQHQILRANLQGAQGHLTDLDALFGVQQAHAGWTQSSVDALQHEKRQFQDALSRVSTGLNRHFEWEEQVLPPLFGVALTKALIVVHHEIRWQLEKTVTLVVSAGLAGTDQKEQLAEKQRVQNETATLTRMVEEHAGTEEQILLMLKKAYQAEAQKPPAAAS